MWFKRKVQSGKQLGRKIGFPTLNFHIGRFADFYTAGVYACELKIHGYLYQGALFLGPKSDDPRHVLEVHVLGFSGNLYDQFVSFEVGQKIREPMKFPSIEALRAQIDRDVKKILTL